MYTLYHGAGSCSLAIKAALTLIGKNFNTITIKLSEGEHLNPEYLKVNPLAKVPALKTESTILTEGMAIQLYLSEQVKDGILIPNKSEGRIEALRWLAFLYCNLHQQYARLFLPERYGSDIDDIKNHTHVTLLDLFNHIDKRLMNSTYLAGKNISAPDLYLMVALHWKSVLKVDLFEQHPRLVQYIEDIYSHPVVGQVFSDEFKQT